MKFIYFSFQSYLLITFCTTLQNLIFPPLTRSFNEKSRYNQFSILFLLFNHVFNYVHFELFSWKQTIDFDSLQRKLQDNCNIIQIYKALTLILNLELKLTEHLLNLNVNKHTYCIRYVIIFFKIIGQLRFLLILLNKKQFFKTKKA